MNNRFSIIEEHKVEGKRLGRHVEHDERSRNFQFGVIVAADQLQKVTHRRYGAILDQGDLGSCTGNAIAGAINSVPLHKKGTHTLKEPDALSLYEEATKLDAVPGEYPPDDTGSTGLAAAKAAKNAGYITIYKHAFGIQEALTALQRYPVITGVNWYEGFDEPDEHGMVEIAGQIRGGHEFVVVGFVPHVNVMEAIVIADNSWSDGWGDNGRFRFTVATWNELLNQDGDATILM